MTKKKKVAVVGVVREVTGEDLMLLAELLQKAEEVERKARRNLDLALENHAEAQKAADQATQAYIELARKVRR